MSTSDVGGVERAGVYFCLQVSMIFERCLPIKWRGVGTAVQHFIDCDVASYAMPTTKRVDDLLGFFWEVCQDLKK